MELAGDKRVIISANYPMFVMGMSHEQYENSKDDQLHYHLVQVIHDNFSILEEPMTMLHTITATHDTMDDPSREHDGYGAAQNIILTLTSAIKAVAKSLSSWMGTLSEWPSERAFFI